MNSNQLIPAAIVIAIVVGIPVAILLIRDRYWPEAPVKTEADWHARQRRVMKLWVFGVVICLFASWLLKTMKQP